MKERTSLFKINRIFKYTLKWISSSPLYYIGTTSSYFGTRSINEEEFNNYLDWVVISDIFE